jgi:hypothetical protein
MIWVAYLRGKGDWKVTILNYYGMASRTKFDIELVPKDAKGLMYAYTTLYNLIEYIEYSISLYSK